MSTTTLIFHELLSWRALLDITAISMGLFFLYRTLVRLGTWKILVGILLALSVFILASMLRLPGIGWVFQNVSQVAVLALIVIFQPELRKILEKVVSLQSGKEASPNQELAEMIADSLWKLAAMKRGAIIVYLGKEPVKERLSGGHILKAEPSEPLIMSIFDPNSPGHDGAVIVDNNKLLRFGVRLPMSQTARLAEEFGTRHHAAMGLAETTDALILVVSEERGTVSSFHQGIMQQFDSREAIAALIIGHQTGHGFIEARKNELRDKRVLLQLVACFVVGGLFWATLTANNQQLVERSLTIPIEYGPAADELIQIGERLEQVRIKLAGPKAAIDDFRLDEPVVKIDLANMVEGKQTILVSPDNIDLAKGVSLVASTPEQIEVELAKIVRKSVLVIPQLVGRLPPHLKLDKVSVIPEKLQVLTPPNKNRGKPLTVSTTPVYLNSIQETSRIFCKVIAASDIQPATRPWQDVEVLIEVSSANEK